MEKDLIVIPKLSLLILIGLKMLIEMNFFIKSNESLAENKKKKTEQLLLKYKHRNDIREHGKHKNE